MHARNLEPPVIRGQPAHREQSTVSCVLYPVSCVRAFLSRQTNGHPRLGPSLGPSLDLPVHSVQHALPECTSAARVTTQIRAFYQTRCPSPQKFNHSNFFWRQWGFMSTKNKTHSLAFGGPEDCPRLVIPSMVCHPSDMLCVLPCPHAHATDQVTVLTPKRGSWLLYLGTSIST